MVEMLRTFSGCTEAVNFLKSREALQFVREVLIFGVNRTECNSPSHHSFPKPHQSGRREEFRGRNVEVRFRAVTFERYS
jgi:hypothetical protein